MPSGCSSSFTEGASHIPNPRDSVNTSSPRSILPLQQHSISHLQLHSSLLSLSRGEDIYVHLCALCAHREHVTAPDRTNKSPHSWKTPPLLSLLLTYLCIKYSHKMPSQLGKLLPKGLLLLLPFLAPGQKDRVAASHMAQTSFLRCSSCIMMVF